jgi:hypothetical protein
MPSGYAARVVFDANQGGELLVRAVRYRAEWVWSRKASYRLVTYQKTGY